jgi:hypothetical protein
MRDKAAQPRNPIFGLSYYTSISQQSQLCEASRVLLKAGNLFQESMTGPTLEQRQYRVW